MLPRLLTEAFTSWAQVILPPQPSKYLELQAQATTANFFFFETVSLLLPRLR